MAFKPSATDPKHRAFFITEKAIDEAARTVRVAFSSEKPVLTRTRSGQEYYEVLDHGDGVDMSRMRSGAAVLKDHDNLNQVGVVDSAEIDSAERMGRATLRFSRSKRGDEEFQDVKDGIRTKISFGYIPGKGERAADMDRDGVPAFRHRAWMPYEISTVSVPEDDSVGVGRSANFQGGAGSTADDDGAETQAESTQTNKRAMTTETATVPAEAKVSQEEINKITASIRAADLERTNSIRAFANKVSISGSEVEKAIKEGVEFQAFTRSFTDGALSTVAASGGNRAQMSDLEIGMSQKERGRFSVVKGIRDLCKTRGLEGLEREVNDQCVKQFGLEGAERSFHLPLDIVASGLDGRRRDLESGTASEGGHTVATDLGGMIELLRNQTKVLEIGATHLTGLRGNLSLPRQDGAATASWVDEEGAVTASAQTFGQLAFTPNRLASQTKYSDLLLAQSSISIENFVRSDLMRVAAIELDRAALHGSGASNQPLGLDGTANIGSLTFGGAPTWADIVEFETDVSAANAMIGNASFLVSAATRGKWKTTVKVASTSATFLIEDNEANGYTVHVSNNITGDVVFYGVWTQLAIATWGAMSLIVDPYTAASTGQRIVTTCSFHDVGVLQPTSFSVSTDSGAQ